MNLHRNDKDLQKGKPLAMIDHAQVNSVDC